jgi:hypothetical protein
MKVQKLFGFALAVWFVAQQSFAAALSDTDFRTNINPALLYFQAFQNMPHFNEADSRHLFADSTAGGWPDDRFDKDQLALLQRYDNSFKLLRRARFAAVPCDWGYDVSDGPEALLPGLAPAKLLAQVARMRVMVALGNGDFDTAREELNSAFYLARQLSTDHILISCLVQNAVESLLDSIILKNYYRLSPDQLDALLAGFDAAPRRGSIADTISSTERIAFFGYIERKVSGLVAAQGNEQLFWRRFSEFWDPIATEADSKSGPDPSAEKIKPSAGGSFAGVMRLLNEMPALYAETNACYGSAVRKWNPISRFYGSKPLNR